MTDKQKNPENQNLLYGGTMDANAIQKKLKQQKLLTKSILIGIFLVIGGIIFFQKNYEIAKQDYIGGNLIRIGNDNGSASGDIAVCNPWRNASFLEMLLFQSLFIADSTYTKINPGLAESYVISEDNVTYTITMRDDQFWSDGTQITAQDVLFSFEGFLRCDNKNSSIAAAFNHIEGAADYASGNANSISGIEVNGSVISIKLTNPYSNFALILTQFVPLPKHILENEDITQITTEHPFFINNNPVCSGEYFVESVDSDNNLIVSKNPHYTNPVSDIDTIMVCWDYENVTIDYYTTTDPSKMVSYFSMKNFTEYPVDVYYYRYFIFNLAGGDDGETNEIMQDLRVRQAIYHAIDVETLANEIYFGKTNLVYGGSLILAEEYCLYDPSKAKLLLEEAQYDFTRPFKISYYSGDTSSRIFVERIAHYLEEIGLTVELHKASATELYAQPDYDMLLKNLSSLNTEDWYNEYLSTNSNISQLLGKEGIFDPLVGQLTSTTDSEQYDKVLQDLVDLEQSLLYKMPMFLLSDAAYVNTSRLSVPDDMSFGNTRYRSDIRFDEWFIKKA